MPFNRAPMSGEAMGLSKLSLFGEIEMLEPESQMMTNIDSFFMAFRNLAGACKAIQKQEGRGGWSPLL